MAKKTEAMPGGERGIPYKAAGNYMVYRHGLRVAGFATPDDRQLFLAAPELLAALTALLESIENVNFGVHDDDGQTYDAIPWAQAEAAIAQATEKEEL